jgi:hypothetical protein
MFIFSVPPGQKQHSAYALFPLLPFLFILRIEIEISQHRKIRNSIVPWPQDAIIFVLFIHLLVYSMSPSQKE